MDATQYEYSFETDPVQFTLIDKSFASVAAGGDTTLMWILTTIHPTI
jgi:hypothetical protein